MTKVKICGITSGEDARYAVEAGAEMLGFNFYMGSPRYISPDEAGKIIASIGPTTTCVGVFVNEAEENIIATASKCGLHAIQLHGDEDAATLTSLRSRTGIELIKAIRVRQDQEIDSDQFMSATAILVDTYSEKSFGGTGKHFDWNLAYNLFFSASKPIILAGGLTPENVGEAIRTVRPSAVDVASGVESSPGKKDPKKVEEFIRNAKNA
jgi:phosphoribosylanthranilate isomerase